MDDRAEMNRHVEAAIRELRAAIESGSCGVCAEMLGAEAQHLEEFRDLSVKVADFTDAQAAKTAELREGNGRVDRSLAEVGLQPAGERRQGLGIVDMAGEMWRTRVRVTDVLTLGGRR
jgi:hypothetical protein